MPPHRQLVEYLEAALDCLEAAGELDAYLPHWAQTEVGRMAEDLAAVLERVGREIPALALNEGRGL